MILVKCVQIQFLFLVDFEAYVYFQPSKQHLQNLINAFLHLQRIRAWDGKNLAVSKKTDTKWNSSSFYGTVPLFVEQRPKNVKQLPKKLEQVL